MASTSSSRPTGGTQGTSRSSSRTQRAGAATFTSDDVDAATSGSGRDGSGRAVSSGADGAPTATEKASGGTSGGAAAGRGTGRGPRRIRLTLARLDPFSVMKMSFLLAIGVGIATVVSTALLWSIVDGIGLWDSMNKLGTDLNNGKPLPFLELFRFSKMVSYSVIVAFVNLVIITALCTLFAFLYNIVAGLLGGLRMTFTDE